MTSKPRFVNYATRPNSWYILTGNKLWLIWRWLNNAVTLIN